MRKPNSPIPKKKYRIIQEGRRYYPQYRGWFRWSYFEKPASYPTNTSFSVNPIMLRVSYTTREEAAAHIRDVVCDKLSKKNRQKNL